MNTSVKAELGSLLLGILCRSFALALPPDQWGYACLLLVTGAACGASIAAYIGKALGLADTGGTIFGKILLNISVVVIFGPAALVWFMHYTDLEIEAAGPLVGGVMALSGVTALVILIPKLMTFLRKFNFFRNIQQDAAPTKADAPDA